MYIQSIPMPALLWVVPFQDILDGGRWMQPTQGSVQKKCREREVGTWKGSEDHAQI